MYMYAIMDTINHPKERNMDKLYIVIPAYNEQDNIEQVINDWYPVIEKHNGNGPVSIRALPVSYELSRQSA